MSDNAVAAKLRSAAKLVVVEAPGGCGKTFQGASYAKAVAEDGKRVLVLTHTHAAADTFAERVGGSAKVEIRTIDSLITEIAAMYHHALGLPADVATWARARKSGTREMADLVARLLANSHLPARTLANRYSVIICDEHQDTTASQAKLIMAIRKEGGIIRIFGDPMQSIYAEKADDPFGAWRALCSEADEFCELEEPHRWNNGSAELGEWILESRERLKCGEPIDLTGALPSGVTLIEVDNIATGFGQFRVERDDAAAIRSMARRTSEVLVLAPKNRTVRSIRGLLSFPIWEGHVRKYLDRLATELAQHQGDSEKIAEAVCRFVARVATGFTVDLRNRLIAEVRSGCAKRTRGLPAKLQDVGRCIVHHPNQRGAAAALQTLYTLITEDPSFKKVRIDHRREYWDANQLGDYDDCEKALQELSQRRTYTRPRMPKRCLSSIHKAKGLEWDSIVLIGCDAASLPDSDKARCELYVALSRAKRNLTVVLPKIDRSPLIRT